jgi:hypothetical protein
MRGNFVASIMPRKHGTFLLFTNDRLNELDKSTLSISCLKVIFRMLVMCPELLISHVLPNEYELGSESHMTTRDATNLNFSSLSLATFP